MKKYDKPITSSHFLSWIGFDIEFELTCPKILLFLIFFFLIHLYIFLIYSVSINKILQGCNSLMEDMHIEVKGFGEKRIVYGIELWNATEYKGCPVPGARTVRNQRHKAELDFLYELWTFEKSFV